MVTALEGLQIFILFISCISGISLSSSIIVVYTFKWKKKQQFSVCDTIFMSMAIINLLLQCFTAINNLVFVFWFDQLMPRQGSLLLFVFAFFFLYDNMWHIAWLSIHYCLKLVNPSHSVCIHMKKRLSASIIPLIVVTSVGLFLINLPYIWTSKIEFFTSKTNLSSETCYINRQQSTFTACNMVLGCCLPFVVTLVCMVLSVGALVGHMYRMRLRASQFSSSPQLQGPVQATTTMILQLLLNLLLYLSIIGVLTYSSKSYVIWETVLWSVILSYPSAQTLTLILGNPKLKKKLLGQQLKK